MSKSTTARWGWVALLVLMSACGGRVGDDDDDDVPREGSTGAASNTSTSGNGSGDGSGDGNGNGNATGGGALCAGTPPHPDYDLCYTTPYPPCLSISATSLKSVLETDRTPTIGPWVGTNEACKMVCCYGVK